MSDEVERERARYEALSALVENYRRERDDAREQLYIAKTELGRWVDRETKAVRERESYQNRVARLEEAIVTSLGQRLEPCMSRHPVTVVMAAGSLFFKIGEAMSCEFQDGDDLLEAVKELVRERDEVRAKCPDCAMWAERSARWHDEMQRAERERDEARDDFAFAMRKMDEQIAIIADTAKERDEARAREAEWAQNSIEWQRNCEEARAEVEHAYREGGALYEAKIAEREAFRSGAEAMREACARWMSEREGISQWVYDDALSALPIPEEP